jgi:flagellar basal body-associated protein FliL
MSLLFSFQIQLIIPKPQHLTMPLSNTSILSIVELALYAVLSPPALFIAYRHGRHGILGYFYLNISIAVRIAADIAQLIDNNSPSTTPSLAAAVLSSIGLSPLLLAISGILHELHHYLLQASATSTAEKQKKKSRWLLFIQIQIHTLCTVGMVLLILGSIHLAEAKSASDANAAYKLRSAGAVLWFVTWLGMIQYIAWLFFRYRGVQGPRSVATLRNWTLVALLFGGAKVIYAAVYTLDHADTTISPITGSFAIKVVLVVGVQFLAVVAMMIGGWMSSSIGRDHQERRSKSARRNDVIV